MNILQEAIEIKTLTGKFLLLSGKYSENDNSFCDMEGLMKLIPPTSKVKMVLDSKHCVIPLYAVPIIYYHALDHEEFEQQVCHYINNYIDLEELNDYIYQLYQVSFFLQDDTKELEAKILEILDDEIEWGVNPKYITPIKEFISTLSNKTKFTI